MFFVPPQSNASLQTVSLQVLIGFLVSHLDVEFQHVGRPANSFADSLALAKFRVGRALDLVALLL